MRDLDPVLVLDLPLQVDTLEARDVVEGFSSDFAKRTRSPGRITARARIVCGNDGVDPSFPGAYLVGPDFGLAAAVVPSAHADLLFRGAVFGRDVGPLGLGEVFANVHFKRLRTGETHAFSDRIVDNVDVAHDRSSGLGGELLEGRVPRKNAPHHNFTKVILDGFETKHVTG